MIEDRSMKELERKISLLKEEVGALRDQLFETHKAQHQYKEHIEFEFKRMKFGLDRIKEDILLEISTAIGSSLKKAKLER